MLEKGTVFCQWQVHVHTELISYIQGFDDGTFVFFISYTDCKIMFTVTLIHYLVTITS